ncbi:MAG: phosphatidylserine decarboxylase [candidate division NC10 bacterium]|nr:phosphatidylserine decarboxylase [candidate division NC10 bacterium]
MIPIAKEGLPFILPLGGVSVVSFLLGFPVLAALALFSLGFVAFFFRDPEREVSQGEGLILSPADGRVVAVRPSPGKGIRVSIFLSLFDVHINRAPVTATVSEVLYRPGAFKVAFAEEASRVNEQNLIRFASPQGELLMRQIAGVLARRIVCWVRPGQKVEAGERIGLIRFGSRVDLELPLRAEVRVKEGDRVRGGLDVIGVML